MITSTSPSLSSLLSLHVPTCMCFLIALTDTATLQGSYNLYRLANASMTEYLRNYNLTTLPYYYYRYIQS